MCITRCNWEETPINSSEQTAQTHFAYNVCSVGTTFITGNWDLIHFFLYLNQVLPIFTILQVSYLIVSAFSFIHTYMSLGPSSKDLLTNMCTGVTWFSQVSDAYICL